MIIFATSLYFFIIQTKVYAFLASEFERNEPYFKGKSILFRKKFFFEGLSLRKLHMQTRFFTFLDFALYL